MAYQVRIFVTLCICSTLYATQLQKDSIAYKIYQNECGANPKNLIHWNKGENFPSLGIGHFIWYPKGIHERFEESFPKFIHYLKTQHIILPKWLENQTYAPWNSKQEMTQSNKTKQLQTFLIHTIPQQAIFIKNRLVNILPKLLKATPKERQKHLLRMFYTLKHSPNGDYILIDYLNFKGDGTNPKERYKNQGWGLLQVLLMMKDTSNPQAEFIKCAKEILTKRVKNAPPSRGEKRWLTGWFNRLNTYNP